MKAERSKVSSLSRELRGQFYAGNRLCFVVSVLPRLPPGASIFSCRGCSSS